MNTNIKKPTTLQERLGFLDGELSTPKHDEIMLWLDKSAELIINVLFHDPEEGFNVYPSGGYSNDWSWREAQLIAKEWALANSQTRPFYQINEKIWEYPITTQQNKGYGNLYTVGFADMYISALDPCLMVDTTKTPIESKWGGENRCKEFIFEVKPTIPSLGELIRQIRHYQSYVPNMRFVVVSPDDRFAKALQDQSIYFCKYPF